MELVQPSRPTHSDVIVSSAVQVTFGTRRPQLLTKSSQGHFAKANVEFTGKNTTTVLVLVVLGIVSVVVAGVLMAWTFGYGQYSKRRGERQTAAAAERSASALTGPCVPGAGA